MTIVLASRSPQRAHLLSLSGVAFEVQSREVDESWQPGEAPEVYVQRLALAKALAVAGELRTRWILGADTTVWIPAAGVPMGKAANREEAKAALEALRDAGSHYVSTGVALLHPARERREVFCVSTRVTMRSFGKRELEAYLDSNDWRDRAGSYAIQGPAAAFVERIEGSYTNVVGLPLAEVVHILGEG